MLVLAGAVLLFPVGTVTGEAAEIHLSVNFDEISPGSEMLGNRRHAGSYPAYFWLGSRFPPTLIATHTYVNPVVALVLGWAVAGEVLTTRLVFGGVVVIAPIALVGRAMARKGEATKICEQRPHASATQQKAAAKSEP